MHVSSDALGEGKLHNSRELSFYRVVDKEDIIRVLAPVSVIICDSYRYSIGRFTAG